MKNDKIIGRKNYRTVRNATVLVLGALLLSSCTSIEVPDALNPTKWDFFADDAALPEGADANAADEQNQGLAADSDAPKPAERDLVANSGSGLSADSQSGNYASPPIERQGAPSDYLSADATQIDEAPAPASAPAVAVTPVQAPPPAARAPAPAPARVAEAPPAEPVFNAPAAPTPQSPASVISPRISTIAPPPPPRIDVRQAANIVGGARDTFDTVIISSSGIQSAPAPARVQPAQSSLTSVAPTRAPSAGELRFPVPGSTTMPTGDPVSVGGMLRVATIYFDNNSASLNARDANIVSASAQLLSERGGSLYVVGHASSRTSDMDYVKHAMTNFQISTSRANQVATALKSAGVNAGQLRVHAVSDTVPLYFEVMPSGEAGNRRVEIYLAP